MFKLLTLLVSEIFPPKRRTSRIKRKRIRVSLKMFNGTENEAIESAFQKLSTFSKSFEPLWTNHDPNMTQMNTFMCFAADRKQWRPFRSKYRDYRGLPGGKFRSWARCSDFRDVKKSIS